MTVPSAPAIRPRAVCPLLWRCCRGRTERRASSPKAGPGGAARSHHAGCALGCFVHSAEHSASAVLSRQRQGPSTPRSGNSRPAGSPVPAGAATGRAFSLAPRPSGPRGRGRLPSTRCPRAPPAIRRAPAQGLQPGPHAPAQLLQNLLLLLVHLKETDRARVPQGFGRSAPARGAQAGPAHCQLVRGVPQAEGRWAPGWAAGLSGEEDLPGVAG